MQLYGLNKLTLLDYPEHLACTVFTGTCNFRCPFCHNASLVTNIDEERISEEEFFSFLQKRQGIIEGVCVTGGEPTLQPDLKDFLKRIKDLDYSVKLDTNGYRPDVLEKLIDLKLIDYVAMDVKNCFEKYELTTGLVNINTDKILKSINLLKEGRVDYEFRTTIVKEYHSIDEFTKIGELIKGAKKYFLQCYQYRDSVREKTLNAMTKEELTSCLEKVKPYVVYAALREID